VSEHLTSVLDGVIQVSVQVATTKHLVVEADICLEKEGNTEGRAKWPRGLRFGSEGPRFLGLWVRIPLEL